MFWQRYRPRSVTALMDEIEAILGQTGGNRISILDDTFVLEPARVLTFCAELKRRGLSLSWICFGRVGLMTAELLQALKDAGDLLEQVAGRSVLHLVGELHGGVVHLQRPLLGL